MSSTSHQDSLQVTDSAMNPVLLRVRDLRVNFGAQEVVHGIDFDVHAGEKLALVGESGSGKSVTALSLVKLLQGAQVSGQAWWRDESETTRDLLSLDEPALCALRGQDIAFVFQEPMTALNPLMTVGAQIAEVLCLKRGMTQAQAFAETLDLLQLTGIAEPERRARTYPHQLSGGQRQRVLIAMALACRPRLLVADEPTTALDVSLRAQILALLSDLQQRFGMAVLLITHDLHTVRDFADRVVVMERGHVVEAGTVDAVLNTPRHPYTQRLVNSTPQRDVAAVTSDAAVVLQAQQLQVRYALPSKGWRTWFKPAHFVAVQSADFALRAGQTLGVVGESGSGKTTLALAVLGLMPCTGDLAFTLADASQHLAMGERAKATDKNHHRVSWQHHAAKDLALRRRVQVVFQDPFSALSPRMTVQELLIEGMALHFPALSAQARVQQVLDALQAVGLTPAEFPSLLQRYPHEFSGGQRQRLSIARALAVQPQILVLDEPTSALDVSTQRQVLQLLQTLQRERGLSYLLITHDAAVIQAMAHQVMVMQGGQVVEAGDWAQLMRAPQHAYTQTLLKDLTPLAGHTAQPF